MAEFTSFESFRAALAAQPGPDDDAEIGAAQRNAQLTKPPGALGRLEDLAIWYASWRGTDRPTLEAPQVIIFAGNHGVTAQGVSAFPAEVTVQMVANFQAGGAAINQLAKLAGARMDVHALDLDRPTQDFTQGPAMTEAECVAALQTGWDAVDPASDLLVAGEMGIGNTTSASAIALSLFGGEAADWIGRGTGVDDAGLVQKQNAVSAGSERQTDKDPLQVLAGLGGRELAAMAGAIAAARHHRIPVILDGFICCAAAACLAEAEPDALAHCIASHESAEQAHQRLLAKIGKVPFLSLGMRLGEGSGAALAIQLLKGAIACHSGMATFAEAGVSEG